MRSSRDFADPLRVRLILRAAVVLLILAGGALTGCGDDDNGPTGPGGDSASGFIGLYAIDGRWDGKVTISINSTSLASPLPRGVSRTTAHGVTAFGALTPSSGSGVALLGTYSDENDSLHLSGSGYTLIGHYDDSVTPPSITGSLSGPPGEGLFGCFLGSSATIKVYCGAYDTDTSILDGTWSMVTIDTVLVGVALPVDGNAGDAITFAGTVARTGTTRAIEFTGVDLTGTGSLDTATNNVSGTWALPPDTGNWIGSLCP